MLPRRDKNWMYIDSSWCFSGLHSGFVHIIFQCMMKRSCESVLSDQYYCHMNIIYARFFLVMSGPGASMRAVQHVLPSWMGPGFSKIYRLDHVSFTTGFCTSSKILKSVLMQTLFSSLIIMRGTAYVKKWWLITLQVILPSYLLKQHALSKSRALSWQL